MPAFRKLPESSLEGHNFLKLALMVKMPRVLLLWLAVEVAICLAPIVGRELP